MSLDLPSIHAGVAMALGTDVLPALPAGYSQGVAATAAALSIFAAQEADRAAARRMAEIEGMRRVFLSAADTLDSLLPDGMAAELRDLAALQPAGVTLGALDKTRREMLPALVTLHALVETLSGPGARSVERMILLHLRDTAEGRALVIPPMG